MTPIIAPWTDVKPTDFANAEAEGMKIGESIRGQDLEAAANAARINVENQRTQLDTAKLQSDTRLAIMDLQQRTANAKRLADIEQEKVALDRETSRMRWGAYTQKVASDLQTRAMYQNTFRDLVSKNPDMTPQEAMMRASAMSGFALGPASTGAAVRQDIQPSETTGAGSGTLMDRVNALPKTAKATFFSIYQKDGQKAALDYLSAMTGVGSESDGSGSGSASDTDFRVVSVVPADGGTEAPSSANNPEGYTGE